METLKQYFWNDQPIRIIMDINSNPHFCASDITTILGYANGRDIIAKLCDPGGVSKSDTPTSSGVQSMIYISESNLYRLVFKSTKIEAERFITWISEDVLPSIRKHGIYATENIIEKALNNPDFIIDILTELKKERQIKEQLKQTTENQAKQIEASAPKVEYYDQVLNSESLILTNVIAKQLGVSAVSLNRFLHTEKIIYKSGESWVLYQKYQNKGYTGTKTFIFKDSYGNEKTAIHTYWTEKGREFVIKFWNKKQGLLF